LSDPSGFVCRNEIRDRVVVGEGREDGEVQERLEERREGVMTTNDKMSEVVTKGWQVS
jgi:hypothetical protein